MLAPVDVEGALDVFAALGLRAQCAMIDPWYNKGVGGERDDYVPYILGLLERSAEVADHVYLWGFPEIVARFIERIPEPLRLVSWLTWYYKNNPSVIRGWRSAQMTCLHLARPDAKLYPEHFLNEKQKEKQRQGKLRYMPGPTSVLEGHLDVIEESLLVGFVGRNEHTGHPAQKPRTVYEKLLLMTTTVGDLVIDPMSGSGTTGEVARDLGRKAILSDISEDYTAVVERRLGVTRLEIPASLSMRS